MIGTKNRIWLGYTCCLLIFFIFSCKEKEKGPPLFEVLKSDRTGLDSHIEIPRIHMENGIHSQQAKHKAISDGHAATAQASAGTASDNRQRMLHRQPHAGRHLLRVLWKNNGTRELLERSSAVEAVRD